MSARATLIVWFCVALLSARCATSSAVTSTQRKASYVETEPAKIIAYIPVWRSQEGFDYAADELYQHITHAIAAFLVFDETDLGAFDARVFASVQAVLPSIVSTAHANGTRASIALGGAADCGFFRLMNAIGADKAHPLLTQTVDRVVELVRAYALDGVDLDLECWSVGPGDEAPGGRSAAEGPHPAGVALASFAEKLKAAMPDKLVSAAVFGTPWYGNNYDRRIADHTDWLGIMSYDLTGSWNGSPVGPHSALRKLRSRELTRPNSHTPVEESYVAEQQGEWPRGGPEHNPILSVEDTIRYWTDPEYPNGHALPRAQFAAGVPLYGYDFAYANEPDEIGGEPQGYKTLRYKDIVAAFPGAENAPDGRIQQPGSTPRPRFVNAPGDYPFAHNVYFETPATAVAKLRFVRELGTQGVIVWELTSDVWENGKSIIKALYQASGRPPKSTTLGHRPCQLPRDVITVCP